MKVKEQKGSVTVAQMVGCILDRSPVHHRKKKFSDFEIKSGRENGKWNSQYSQAETEYKLTRFSPGTPVSSHRPKTCMLGSLVSLKLSLWVRVSVCVVVCLVYLCVALWWTGDLSRVYQPRLSPDDRWDRLQPPRDPTDGLSAYSKWMNGWSLHFN